jgi:hypothetical protein
MFGVKLGLQTSGLGGGGGGGFSMSIAIALREERATIVAMMMNNFILSSVS